MPTRISKALAALAGMEQKAARGVQSNYVPTSKEAYGAPPADQTDVLGLVTPERQREVALKTPTVSACVESILDFACSVPIRVRSVDPAQKPPMHRSGVVRELLYSPNDQDNERLFRRKVLRDIVTLGQGGIEIEPDANGQPAFLWPMDAARLRIIADKHGTITGFSEQDILGQPPIVWRKEEVIHFSLDGRTNTPYPVSKMTLLFACGVLETLVLSYIGASFTDSNVPYGVIDIGEVNEVELKAAIAIWNQQMQQLGQNKLLLTGSKGHALNIHSFQGKLQELDAKNLLLTIRSYIMGIMGVTVNELGEAQDVNKSNGFNLSYTFKKRAIEPLLDCYVQCLTHQLIKGRLGFKDVELGYDEIDSRDELLQGQIDDLKLKNGLASINDVRNRTGQPNIAGGEEPTINLGGSIIPVSMINDFAQAQLDALQAINLQTMVAIQQAQLAMTMTPTDTTDDPQMEPGGSPPLVRSMQPPMKFTTPDGAGSSTAKFKLPKPGGISSPNSPQAARGPVQANRNQGVRKEDVHGR